MDSNIDRFVWRKSTYSGDNGNCIEVAALPDTVAIRDTKDRQGTMLRFTPESWRAFTETIKQ